MKDSRADRLYELLPVVYRMRDAERGEPLKALLRVIAEQVNLVEDDIKQLYENWFIETCEDWVVPYIGDLIGYEPVHEAGEPSPGITPQGKQRNKILIPRREVANTIRYRRRKGTLALLELLSNDVAGWPARAVEFYKLLGWSQALNHLHLDRGETVDLRNGSALDLLNGPFDRLAHGVDVRRINSTRTKGRYNVPNVGLFIWRLKSNPLTQASAFCFDSQPHHFTFSIIGNDTPLFIRPEPESDPSHIADEYNLPVPIRRRLFDQNKELFYGVEKSLQIWIGKKKRGQNQVERQPVLLQQIVPADLSNWQYSPGRGEVAVDPVLGRIAFPNRNPPRHGVWVNYHYGFSAEIGGGEYERPLSQPPEYFLCRVGINETLKSINEAILYWRERQKAQQDEEAKRLYRNVVIEITDSGVYDENLDISISENEYLQIRAANRRCPAIALSNTRRGEPNSFMVKMARNSRFTLDGLIIVGRALEIEEAEDQLGNYGGHRLKQTIGMTEVTIRHVTLVPGWELSSDCEPKEPGKASLFIYNPKVCVKVEHSIIGSIQVEPTVVKFEEEDTTTPLDDEIVQARCRGIWKEIRLDPIRICINDSILDATDPELEVLGAPGCPVALAVLNIARSTVFGQIHAHAIELGENCIFDGRIIVARRQKGCLRFCYVTPESLTPRRFRCQPDLVMAPINEAYRNDEISESESERSLEQEQTRVRPIFNSVRYGTPTYCQLSDCCANEIKRGADDESEMGVFHNLYQPQRMANLRVRLDEYLPARMDVGIILSS